MEQAEKKELLGNLYALRAGLSVISQEKDNADKALEEYSDITYKASRKIHNAKNWLDSADSKRRAAKMNTKIRKEFVMCNIKKTMTKSVPAIIRQVLPRSSFGLSLQ